MIMSVFRVALVQKRAFGNSPDRNLSLAVSCIKEAAQKGADMVLFPEMWSNGYTPPYESAFDDPFDPLFEKERKLWLGNAVQTDSEYVRTLRQAAKDTRTGVCATFLSFDGKYRNTAVVIDRNGEMILTYHKVHTCDFSLEALLEPGSGFGICEFDGIKLGVMICYDREFPESVRSLMLMGAEIILVPNACPMDKARLGQLSARAFENMTGMAMANYSAKGWGRSCAFSPAVYDSNGAYRDNTVFMADEESEGIFIAGFDMAQIRSWRESETWGNAYRKPYAYKNIVSNEIKEPFKRENSRQ